MIRTRVLIVVVACSVAAVAARQAPSAPPPFRIAVDVVSIDAVVTDRKGDVVRDLTAADFDVFQDGRRQTVTVAAFVPVISGGGSGASPVGSSAARSTAATEAPPVPAPPITRERVRRRTALLDAITAALDVHEAIEERVLYPALKAHPEARDIVLEGYQEHHVADVIVAELREMGTDDERWGAKLKVLEESIEHHIGEEEGEMFRTARAVMTRAELQREGARMAAIKSKAERDRLRSS